MRIKPITYVYLITFIVIVSFISYLLYNQLEGEGGFHNKVFKRIPSSAAFLYLGDYSKDFKNVNNRVVGLVDFFKSQSPFVKKVLSDIDLFNEFFQIYFIKKKRKERPVSISGHINQDYELDYIISFEVEEGFSGQVLNSVISDIIEKEGMNIYSIEDKGNKIYFIVKDDILWISRDIGLLKKVSNPVSSIASIHSNIKFDQLLTLENIADKTLLYINVPELKIIASLLINEQIKKKLINNSLSSNWILLDLTLGVEDASAVGYLGISKNSNSYLKLFEGQSAQNMTLFEILPYNTSYIYYEGVSNPESFYKELLKIKIRDKNIKSSGKMLEKYEKFTGNDFTEDLISILGNQKALVFSKTLGKDTINKYLILEMKKDKMQAPLELLKSFSSKLNQKVFPKDTIYKLNKILESNVISEFLGIKNAGYFFNYFINIKNYVVFSTKKGINEFLESSSDKKNIYKNPRFNNVTSKFLSTSSVFSYIDLKTVSNNFLKEVINPNLKINKDTFRTMVSNLGELVLQLTSEPGGFTFINIVYSEKQVVDHEVLLDLEAPLYRAPKKIKNHITGKPNIFLHDKKGNIYLLDHNTKLMWKKNIQDQILGDVYQVDAFKNNKLQILFTTKDKIHLMDKNGDYVDNYPINLGFEMKGGLNLMDYESNKDYRLLLFSKDDEIYNYNIKGNLVKGWKKPSDLGEIRPELFYAKVNKKDYLFVVDKKGQVSALKRDGSLRKRFKNKFSSNITHLFISKQSDLVAFYADGTVNRLLTQDKIKTFKIPSKEPIDFEFYNSKSNSLILSQDEKQIFILDFDSGDTLFSRKLKFRIIDSPSLMRKDREEYLFYLDNKHFNIGKINDADYNYEIDISNPNKWNVLKIDKKLILLYDSGSKLLTTELRF